MEDSKEVKNEPIADTVEITAKEQHRVIGKPFKKGESGNPNGRPKGSVSIIGGIKKYLEGHPEKLYEIVKYFIDNKDKWEYITNQVDGKPKQSVEMSGSMDIKAEISDIRDTIKTIAEETDDKDTTAGKETIQE